MCVFLWFIHFPLLSCSSIFASTIVRGQTRWKSSAKNISNCKHDCNYRSFELIKLEWANFFFFFKTGNIRRNPRNFLLGELFIGERDIARYIIHKLSSVLFTKGRIQPSFLPSGGIEPGSLCSAWLVKIRSLVATGWQFDFLLPLLRNACVERILFDLEDRVLLWCCNS